MKGLLRVQYELVVGEVSDRTWFRVKKALKLKDENDFERFRDVQTYAKLRRMSPKGRIKLEDVRWYQEFHQMFPDECQMQGKDIIAQIKRVLISPPVDQTIYRWGHEIGVPIYAENWYGKTEIKQWIGKLVSQRHFKIRTKFIGIEKLAA